MHRDLSLILPTSDDALVYASGALAAVTQAHALSDTERERLESSYQSIGEFLTEHDFFGPLLEDVHSQGSMAIGATTKPEGKAEFDVDLVARLNAQARRFDAIELLEKLDEATGEYARQHGLKVKPKRRCSQVQYAAQMHADVTPVIDWPSNLEDFGAYAGLVPDRERGEHLGTNPRGYVKFFNKAALLMPRFSLMETREVLAKADVLPLPGPAAWNRPLAQYVQLFKIHRNVHFAHDPDSSPTSTFITTQVALAYRDLLTSGAIFQSPLHLLLALWQRMPQYVTVEQHGSDEHWVLCNPTQSKENLADRMNTSDRQEAYREWRQKFVRDVVGLAEAYMPSSGAGLTTIASSIKENFGARSSKALTDSYAASVQRDRSAGIARIAVTGSAAVAPLIAVASTPHTYFGEE